MLASPGLPLYGHSPPGGFLTELGAPCRRAPRWPLALSGAPTAATAPTAPRPCLRPTAAPGAKKRVVFADAQGLALTHVRVMREPSDVPPRWSVRAAPAAPPPPPGWELAFPQPASNYVDFRRRISEGHVSLENVIVKEAEGFLTGTVKVKNIGFQKEVFLRWSADGWQTSEDAFCAFVDAGAAAVRSPHDTFSFRVQLPAQSRRLDFCVGFRCGGAEAWDNNGGANYCVALRDGCEPPPRAPPAPPRPSLWSEFASWQQAPGDVPYW